GDLQALDEPCGFESLEVDSDAVGMAVQPFGDLARPPGPPQLTEEPHDGRSSPLGRSFVRPRIRVVRHARIFSQLDWTNNRGVDIPSVRPRRATHRGGGA